MANLPDTISDGQDDGPVVSVIIPARNAKNLMLRNDVVEAVALDAVSEYLMKENCAGAQVGSWRRARNTGDRFGDGGQHASAR